MRQTLKSRPALIELAGAVAIAIAAWQAFAGVTRADLPAYGAAAALALLGVCLVRRAAAPFAAALVALAAVAAGLARANGLAFGAGEIATLGGAVVLAAGVAAGLRAIAGQHLWAGVLAAPVAFVALALGLAAPHNATSPLVARSVHVTMDDGVRIAVDWHLPRGWTGERLPTIVVFTRYFRASELRFPFNILLSNDSGHRNRLAAAGYASVMVDVRGSGASFGFRQRELSEREIADFPQVVDWVIAQPWSNGIVGAEGVSYGGTTAEMLMLRRHPAVKAVATQYALFDSYADAAFPGGLANRHIVEAWGEMLGALDANRPPPGVDLLTRLAWGGVKPVDGPDGRRLLQDALEEHRRSYDFKDGAGIVEYRDDVIGPDGVPLFHGPMNALDSYRDLPAAVLVVSGWMDGGYQHSAFKRIANIDDPRLKVVIGPWNHGPSSVVDPCGATPEARMGRRSDLTLPFFDHHLKGVSNGYDALPRIRYFSMCGGGWRGADRWPPTDEGTVLHLGPGTLATDPPQAAASLSHRVDPLASSGPDSRWSSLVQLPNQREVTRYGDRAPAGTHMLVFRGAPLSGPLVVTGHPLLTLSLAASGPDGALFAYLEDEAPDGTVRYVTEGVLRLANRAVMETPFYADFAPVRSHLRADARPMPVDTPVTIEVGMLPISYRFAPGHRVRLSIAGADADNFLPLAAQAGEYSVHLGPGVPGTLVLPVDAAE